MPDIPDVPPAPATPPAADKAAPPVWGPLLGLLGSQKALVMLIVLVGTLVLVGMGRVSWDDAKGFLMVIVPSWMGAHAIQDGLQGLKKETP